MKLTIHKAGLRDLFDGKPLVVKPRSRPDVIMVVDMDKETLAANPYKDIDILQGQLIERTDQALHTARRDAETIRVLREALSCAAELLERLRPADDCGDIDPEEFDDEFGDWIRHWKKLSTPS